MSFVDVLDAAGVPGATYVSLEDLERDYPRKLEDRNGVPLRQLVITKDGSEFAIRAAYDRILRYFVFEQKRVGYPSSAPDATGNWQGFVEWFNQLLSLSLEERGQIRARVVNHVLETIPEKVLRPEERRSDPALFEETLRNFPLAPPRGSPRERTGAALQGMVFGFLRADNPHLQIRVDRVRAGGERIGKIGDVDGWDGVRLAISAEVKQYAFRENHLPAIARFLSSVAERGAVGIVAAIEFDEPSRASLDGDGIVPLSVLEMLKIVKLWDLAKQRIAVAAFSYFIDAVEGSAPLYQRYKTFLEDVELKFEAEQLALAQGDAVIQRHEE